MTRLALLAGLVLLSAQAAAAPLAFPGAGGYGAQAVGGRGGTVYEVTSLDDSGPGSLRACAEAAGPRTCVFRIDGTISVLSPVLVREPYLTIAGQTAPGGGIALRLAADAAQPMTPLIFKNTHDVILRHIRLRPGPSANPAATDALTMENVHDVIVDHVSTSWAPDENLNLHRTNYNVTVQWSILAEGLMPHSKGTLTCSSTTSCQSLTLHHNLYISNRDRNPNVNSTPDGAIDFINNVVHNPKTEFVEVWAQVGGSWVNLVGNSFRKGPSTWNGAHAIGYHDGGATGSPRIYQAGNASEVPLLAPEAAPLVSVKPVRPLSVGKEDAARAYRRVLGAAGAGACPRDAVDRRLVAEVASHGGMLITDPAQVGGWPALASGSPPQDLDQDGMPDSWETVRGTNPAVAADGNGDDDGDGYTNLEEYLAERACAVP
jgi:pectate lyase